jgi:hypothetical protein
MPEGSCLVEDGQRSAVRNQVRNSAMLTCPVSGRRTPGYSMPIPRRSDEQYLATDRVTVLVFNATEVPCAETCANDNGIRFSRDNRDLQLGDVRESESDK